MAERGLIQMIFKNLFNSLKPRQVRGNKMGKDLMGNQYFEIPSDPAGGKRKPTRWYDPPMGLDFKDPIPAEWESWLRMRRLEPPTEEEISHNQAVSDMKKHNAAKIEAKRLAEGGSLPTTPQRGPESFPSYPGLHAGEVDPKSNK